MPEIITERRGATLVITLNRPDHANAMTIDMANALYNTVKLATTDRGIRLVLLWGAGGHFMDGMDMSFYSGDINLALENANKLVLPYHSVIREFQAMDKPVLSVVEGKVTGAGMSLMLASDLVIAARSTTFNTKFVDFALTPDGGCSYFLPRKIGASRAMELLMLNETIDSSEAERLHLVNRVVDDEKLHESAVEWADRLVDGPTRAYGAVKKLVMHSFEHELNAHLGMEHSCFGQSTRSFDFREAVKAYFDKRQAKFTGN